MNWSSPKTKTLKSIIGGLVISASAIILNSCDAILLMPYQLRNKTQKDIKVSVKNYPLQSGIAFETTDTIVILKPDEIINIGWSQGIGFPWETRKLFRACNGSQNFKILDDSTLTSFKIDDQYWKYRNGIAFLNIRNKNSSYKKRPSF